MAAKRNPVCLTHSEVTMLHACAWKQYLKYELMLDPAGGRDELGALNVGTLVHEGIAEVYRTIQRMQLVRIEPTVEQLHAVSVRAIDDLVAAHTEATDVFAGDAADEYRAAYADDVETAQRCVDLFVQHIALPLIAKRYDVIAVEFPFRVPLLTKAGRRSGDELEGVFDLLLRDRGLGTIVIGENKTTSTDASQYETKLSTDGQTARYVYAARHMFGPKLVSGTVLLNVIRKAYPRTPKFIKDGTVSVAEVDTTRDLYQHALDVQPEPDYLTKARAALAELNAIEGDLDDRAAKRHQKATEALAKAGVRWDECQAKQRARLEGLPDISRFVAQHEETISEEQVERVALDTWNAARLIRLFRRKQLRRWRNGSACHAYNRLCAYHDACVEDVIEPGELLTKRPVRHREVVEAAEQLGDGATPEALQRVLMQFEDASAPVG